MDYFSSIFVLPFQDDQCKLLRFLACITGSQDVLRDCICFACLKLVYGLFDALCLCCRHRDCTFLDLSAPITPVEKNSLSTVSTPIRMPFFVHPSMSFKTVSGRESSLLTSAAPRNALEPSTVQLMVARQLKWYVPFLNFEVIMLSMSYILSYLGMACLSIATSRNLEHVVSSHHHYCTVSHPKAADQHIVIPNLLYHTKHPPAARDAPAPVLCALYEPGVVRSLCILAVPAHVKESGQKIAVAIQRVVPVRELKF